MRLVAEINGKYQFYIDKMENEDKIADFLCEKYGEVLHPLNGIPLYMEASAWCFNGRCAGDNYEAEDEEGTILFTIEIMESRSLIRFLGR